MKEEKSTKPGVLPDRPTLSVCMIVRDEEETLPRCLKSVKGVADELIVVDTGSTDHTMSVAKDFGAKVFHFDWCDDFAAARNESLKHATADWVLHIDADEELAPESVPHLRYAMLKSTVLYYLVKCDNGPLYEGPRYHWFGRLMRNYSDLRFHRPYHEELGTSTGELGAVERYWQVEYARNIVIRHHGYASSDMPEKWQRGLRIMSRYIKENPDDSYILTKLGAVCSILGRCGEAEAYLKKALDIDPNSVETNYAFGVFLLKQDRPKAAINYLSKAVARDPTLAEAQADLGAAYTEVGMLDEAIAEIKKALNINAELASARRHLGWVYTRKGQYDQGIAELKKAIAVNPDVPTAHMNLAIAYMKKGMLNHSIAEYKVGLSLEPEDALAHTNLGVAYEKKGMLDEAITQHKKAISLNRNLTNAYINLGVVYHKKGMFDKAIAQYNAGLSIDANDAEAHYNLAAAYYAKGIYKEAIKHCDRAFQLGAEVQQLMELLEPFRS